MRSLRIAFVTPEFPTEYATGGGLGSYLRRMTGALVRAGHRPEVFVTSLEAPGTLVRDRVVVHRVRRAESRRALGAALRVARALRLRRPSAATLLVADALALANAVRVREAHQPYDLVQSADFLASGLFVASRYGRPHLVRCSSDGELWARANGDARPGRSFEAELQLASVRGADAAYAPSRFLANHLSRTHALRVGVVRPPVYLEAWPEKDPELPLPPRYLVHFGQLAGAKGTPVLARALGRVFAEAPDFAMVWAGPDYQDRLPEWRRLWGPHADRVVWVGQLEKPALYGVLAGAEAAVLPSTVDNLPNTVIESLLLGLPVIGSDGASIDELVEPGRTGELVPIGNAEALASALLRCWRGESPVRRGFRWSPPIAAELEPANAVAHLLRFAGVG